MKFHDFKLKGRPNWSRLAWVVFMVKLYLMSRCKGSWELVSVWFHQWKHVLENVYNITVLKGLLWCCHCWYIFIRSLEKSWKPCLSCAIFSNEVNPNLLVCRLRTLTDIKAYFACVKLVYRYCCDLSIPGVWFVPPGSPRFIFTLFLSCELVRKKQSCPALEPLY